MTRTTCLPSDNRWTISTEYTGHISGKPRHVVRFCGERISDHAGRAAAIVSAVGEKARRAGALIIEGIPAAR